MSSSDVRQAPELRAKFLAFKELQALQQAVISQCSKRSFSKGFQQERPVESSQEVEAGLLD